MSIVTYSTKGPFQMMEKGYTQLDETFSFSMGLHSCQVGSCVIVVFQDSGNDMEAVLRQLRTNVPFSDHILQPLKGAFSFLVYDQIKKRLEVFRSLTADPLFYVHSQDGLSISNNLQSLARFSTDLNEDYFRLYLHTELTEMEHTPYQNVKRLLPAHKLTKNKDQELTIKKFWSLPEPEKDHATLEDHIVSFSNILADIVRESVAGQQVIACEVSGGLDSSSVACLAANLKSKDSRMVGYTYIFDEISDGKPNKEKADIIYQHTGITPEYLNLSNYWSFKEVQEGLPLYDEPSFLSLNWAMIRDLNRMAKEREVTLLLSGEGGDELLYATSHYLRDWLFQGKVGRAFAELSKMAAKKKQPLWKMFSIHLLPACLPPRWRYRLESKANQPMWRNTGFALDWYRTPKWIGNTLQAVTYEEVEVERRKVREASVKSIYMRENLERLILINPCPWVNNNIGNPANLKWVYPFRDPRLIQFLFTLPARIKWELSEKKKGIREGLRNIVPRETLQKPDRSAFTEIFRKGFRKESRFVDHLIQTSRAADFGWIQKDRLQEAVERYRYGFNDELGPLLQTFGLELWLRHHGY